MGRIAGLELLARLNQAFTPRYNGRGLTIRRRHEMGQRWSGPRQCRKRVAWRCL